MADKSTNVEKSRINVGLVVAFVFVTWIVTTVWVVAQQKSNLDHKVKEVEGKCLANAKELTSAKKNMETRLTRCESDNSVVKGDIRVIKNDMAYMKETLREIKDAVK